MTAIAGLAGFVVTLRPLVAQAEPSVVDIGWWEIVFSGGATGVAILLTLLGLSVAAGYLVFDQAMTLRRRELLPDGLFEAVRQPLARGDLAAADAACQRSPSVLGYTLLSGLADADLPWPQVEKAVEDALVEQSARLMRRIEYLSVIGGIAPMVGLLGTVTGMILAFQQVSATQGAADAADLAEGIYQALVTTVGGLLVAIPSLAAFAILRNRLDALMAEVAHQASLALAPLKRRPQRPVAARVFQSPAGSATAGRQPPTGSGGPAATPPGSQ